MGKGGGCVPSKKKHSSSAEDASRRRGSSTTVTNNAPIASDEDIIDIPADTLAKRMKKGAEGVEGVEAVLFRVPETLPADVLELMKVPPKDPEITVITAAKLTTADGFLFGFPTRYGCMAAQMKLFFDSTGQL